MEGNKIKMFDKKEKENMFVKNIGLFRICTELFISKGSFVAIFVLLGWRQKSVCVVLIF